MRVSRCSCCGKEITEKDDKFKFSNKTHCGKCYEMKLKNKEEYDDLVRRIHEYFNLGTINTMILKQIKNYTEDYNFTYGGIIYCLWYLTEVKKVQMDVKYGIAMVKYEYDNARRYFESMNKIQMSVDKVENHEIKIVHKECKINRKDNREKILFDLDII